MTTSGIPRRDFIKGVIAAGAAVSTTAYLFRGSTIIGQGSLPGAVERLMSLNVNGQMRRVDVMKQETLAMTLRYKLGLTGTKIGCDRGACGACTMIVDGRTVYACSTLAIEAQGKQIRTVEGLANGTTLHPVQQAFCDVDALMCGFCTPGFVVAATALLEKYPNPTPEQARKGLDGNICRCGTFVRIMEATMKAAATGVRRG